MNAIVLPSGDQRGAGLAVGAVRQLHRLRRRRRRARQMCEMRRPLFQSASLRVKSTSRPSGESCGSVRRGTFSRSTMPIGRGDCAADADDGGAPGRRCTSDWSGKRLYAQRQVVM